MDLVKNAKGFMGIWMLFYVFFEEFGVNLHN